jgi:glyoxylase-like metal-dependent hydrolase (beta-lactamase superfamily II)
MRAGAPCTAVPIEDDVWQLRSRSRSCNSYLFKGPDRTVLIDAGLNAGFEALAACLTSLGMQPGEIDTIILTHEHFDHIAAVPRFSPAVGSFPRTVWPRTRLPMATTSPSSVALSARPPRTSRSR